MGRERLTKRVEAHEHQNLCRRPITTIEGVVPAVDRA
jgi:hypothetical protein